ncbi:ester cyclase [Melittangium boletus]|uniref:ester cyclase n=1 Tax=Melittangium boletus TaxID=83453 RepID=UPI003DA52D87
MDTPQIRELYARYLTGLYIQRDVESIGQCVAPEVVTHPLPPGIPAGLPGMKMLARVWLESFSDIHFTIETLIHEQGMAASRTVISAVHSGGFMGIPATGRRVEVVDHVHFRVHQGRIVEMWDQLDMMTLLHQLGAVPSTAQAA